MSNAVLFIMLCALVPQYWFLKQLLQYIKEKAKANRKVRNDLLAFAYLIINLGPNVSAYSVVQILIVGPESRTTLIIVFIAGLLLNYLGRKIRDYISLKTQPNRENTKSMLEMQWMKKEKTDK